jgi:thiamine biosynthesis lipoprotein
VEPGSEAEQSLRSAALELLSGVVKINENAGLQPVPVRADLIAVLEQALHYAELSGGAFDPTIGPLVKLWDIESQQEPPAIAETVPPEGADNAGQEPLPPPAGTGKIPPTETEIARALALVNWRDLVVNKEAETAFLRRQGMALDLGAIAKGYAADEAVRIAREGKARRGIFDLGGNIAVLGGRGDGKEAAPWRIGVQDPLKQRGSYIGVLPVRDKSVVTSGVYERYFEHGGRRYHHILSTKDGWPVSNGLLSVTITAERSIDADALSTAVFALGYEAGSALVESLENIDAVFVFEDRTVKITSGLAGIFSLVGSEYSYRN